ncbi:MAG: hypothetical protein M0Z83_01015 [Betaproteobacteria bacterium]|nr:hypothetical protein [Betaproteobacteria bacterium]
MVSSLYFAVQPRQILLAHAQPPPQVISQSGEVLPGNPNTLPVIFGHGPQVVDGRYHSGQIFFRHSKAFPILVVDSHSGEVFLCDAKALRILVAHEIQRDSSGLVFMKNPFRSGMPIGGHEFRGNKNLGTPTVLRGEAARISPPTGWQGLTARPKPPSSRAVLAS